VFPRDRLHLSLKISAAGKFETLNKFIPDYTASYSTRRYSSQLPVWGSQITKLYVCEHEVAREIIFRPKEYEV